VLQSNAQLTYLLKLIAKNFEKQAVRFFIIKKTYNHKAKLIQEAH